MLPSTAQIREVIKLFLFILAAVFLAGIIWFYYHFDPASEVFFLKCPFHAVTGLQCPGCGSQRAAHELMHFNFRRAWQYNPLLILAMPYVVLGFAFNFEAVRNRYPHVRKVLFGARAIYLILFLILVFWIVRNLAPA